MMDEDPNWATSSYVCIWIGGRPVFFWFCLYIPIHVTANVSWLRLDTLGRSLPHCTLASLYPGIFQKLPLPGAGGAVVGGREAAEPCNSKECILTKSIECHTGDRGRGASSPVFGVLQTYPFNPSHPRKPFCAKRKAVSPSGIDT